MDFINLTTENFKIKTSKKDKLYLIEFYSDICDPCKAIKTSLEKVSAFFEDKIEYCKVDTDVQPKLSQFFEAYCTPSIILYMNEKILKYIPGYKQSKELIEIIKNYLD